MPSSVNLRTIAGRQTTAGAAEETLNLSLDGSAPAASISVPAGQVIIISGWVVTAEAPARFRFQQASGSGFFDISYLRVAADGTVGLTDYGTVSIQIVGGVGVSFRVRVESPAGATPVTVAMRGYTEPI